MMVLGKGADNRGKTVETPNCQKDHKQTGKQHLYPLSSAECGTDALNEQTRDFTLRFPVMLLEELMQDYRSSEF